MVAVTCCALLLLIVFPLQAIAGRHFVPAGPPASSMQMKRAPVVQVPAAPRRLGRRAGLVGVDDSPLFQARSPPTVRKLLPRRTEWTMGATDMQNIAFHENTEEEELEEEQQQQQSIESIYGQHRLLVGSSPPTCAGKCGICSPCNPIHISLGSPHGELTQQEYYPEVWRCKCGSRYFMP